MKTTLKNVEKFWTLIIEWQGGTRNNYRFATKAQAER